MAAPDGSGLITADKLVENTAGGVTHFISQSVSGFSAGETVTYSAYVKAGERTWVQFRLIAGGAISTNRIIHVNLATGDINSSYNPGNLLSFSATPVVNGWYRLSMTTRTDNAGALTPCIFLAALNEFGNPSNTVQGDGVSGFYIWGAQLERGSVVTEYQSIGSTAGVMPTPLFTKRESANSVFVTDIFDEVTYNPTYPLIKNLLSYSEQFDNAIWGKSNATVTANAAIAPDGTLSADLLASSGAVNDFILTVPTVAIGTVVTFSVFLKNNNSAASRLMARSGVSGMGMVINWSGASITSISSDINGGGPLPVSYNYIPVGNGWYRVYGTYTTSEVNQNVRIYPADANDLKSVFVWGAQLEVGSVASDYQGIGLVNKMRYTEQFDNAIWVKTTGTTVVPNSTVSPDGTSTADRIVYNGTGISGDYRIVADAFSPVISVNGVTYTTSIWLKADSPVSIRLYGNSAAGGFVTCNLTTTWQRFSTTGVGNGLSNLQLLIYSVSGDNSALSFYMWGAQIEEGKKATNYQSQTIGGATTALAPFAQRNTANGTNYVSGYYDEFSSFPFVDSSLVLWLDAAQPESYPGTGNNWISLTSDSSISNIRNDAIYSTQSGGGFIKFDGVNHYVNFNVPSLAAASVATIEMWVRINSATGMPFGFTSYDVYFAGGGLGYNTGSSDVYGLTPTQMSTLGIIGNWKHLVFVMRNNTSSSVNPYTNNKIYVNGSPQSLSQILATQSATSMNFNTGVGVIGGWNGNLSYKPYMDCAVFKIYNRELTASEIELNYTALRKRYEIQ
jgi:hypothetical protein